jgi:nucleoside-diphosphate-sugar epimerase
MEMMQRQPVTPTAHTTIAVTGGTGFVGSHLLELLLQLPNVKVRLLSRKKPNFKFETKNLEVVIGDLSDKVALSELLTHGSTLINLAYSNASSPALNLANAKVLAQACALAGVAKVLHCSTAAVFGSPGVRVIDEEVACVPRSVYGLTKLKIEEIFSYFSKNNYQLFILRPTQVFGLGGLALTKFINEIRHGNAFLQYGRECLYGARRLNLVTVTTLVNTIIFVLSNEKVAPGIYVVAQDQWSENNYCYVADNVYSATGKSKKVPRVHLPVKLLQALLWLLGREEYETYREYSNAKLLGAGFVNEESFPQALNLFISELLIQSKAED